MKKLALLILCLLFLAGCSSSKTSFDGKDRPSSRGQLQVVNNVLSGEDGKPVMLRGISHHGVSLSGMYINADTYHDISSFLGCNVIRLALYTWGVGVVGYSTGGDKNRLYQDVIKGVEAAEANDMYAIVDWHILEDGDPNRYIEDALDFFARISADLKDKNNVLYEICNEPNKTDWPTIKKYAEQVIPGPGGLQGVKDFIFIFPGFHIMFLLLYWSDDIIAENSGSVIRKAPGKTQGLPPAHRE